MQEGGERLSKFFMFIILAVIIFLFVLFLTKIKLKVFYHKREKDDQFSLEISAWRGLLYYKLEIPVVEVKKTRPSKAKRPLPRWIPRPASKVNIEWEKKDGGHIIEKKEQIYFPGMVRLMTTLINIVCLTQRYGTVILYLFRRIHLRRLHWCTKLGTGDPSHTGFITGLAWGLKGALVSFIHRLFISERTKPFYKVVPDFEHASFITVFNCIFEVRFGYIMLTGIKVLLMRIKIMIGG